MERTYLINPTMPFLQILGKMHIAVICEKTGINKTYTDFDAGYIEMSIDYWRENYQEKNPESFKELIDFYTEAAKEHVEKIIADGKRPLFMPTFYEQTRHQILRKQ